MALAVDRNLNLVLPIYDDKDQIVAWVHSAPIGREVFETYFRVLGRTFSAIHGDDADSLGATAGPRMAALLLRDEARKMGQWEGDGGVERGLMNEIKRLTNVVLPGVKGWETLPYDDATRTAKINADDAAEVDNALVFFTVGWWVYPKSRRAPALNGASKMWGGHCTSSSVTAFAAGLQTSTEEKNTGQDVKTEIERTQSSLPF
jgi:hypothetical protein